MRYLGLHIIIFWILWISIVLVFTLIQTLWLLLFWVIYVIWNFKIPKSLWSTLFSGYSSFLEEDFKDYNILQTLKRRILFPYKMRKKEKEAERIEREEWYKENA